MSDLTIERLEDMQEKITPGDRYLHEDDWDGLMVVNDAGRHMTAGDQLRVVIEAGHPERDGESIVAIPKLIAALIAEKRAHQRLREDIEALRDLPPNDYRAHARRLSFIFDERLPGRTHPNFGGRQWLRYSPISSDKAP